jgi:hypothetical protein
MCCPLNLCDLGTRCGVVGFDAKTEATTVMEQYK